MTRTSFFNCANMFRVLVLCALLLDSVLHVEPAPSLKNVTVFKCCDLDHYIAKDTSREDGYTCSAGSLAQPTWLPKIFLARKGKLVQPVSVPSNWVLKRAQFPTCGRDVRPAPIMYIEQRTPYVPFENGSLYLIEYDKIVRPDKYCIDYQIVFVCLDEVVHQASRTLPRVKKCCGDGAVYKDTKRACMKIKGDEYSIEALRDTDRFASVTGFPDCNAPQRGDLVVAGKLHEANLLDNGSLLLPSESNALLSEGNFCLEHVLENAGRSPSIFTCHGFLPPSVPAVSMITESDVRFILYPIGLALSAVFLAATLAAGTLIRTNHHALQWKCQTNHLICLLLGYILLCVTHISGRYLGGTPYCTILAVSMHFLFLAAFFWLNTMCFNIWWTFRDFRAQSMEKSQERCRLRLYEVYAWGLPLLIAAIAAILDNIPESSEYSVLRPKFGTSNCWFHGDMEILTYFFGPVGVLLTINLLLFVVTTHELTCGLWKRELETTTERAAIDRICLKLVVVMGVTWIADVISWAVGGPQEIWYLTDFINCLQGVLIFIVVGCRPPVLSAVKKWWSSRKPHTTGGTVSTTNHHSSSSQAFPSMGDTITNNSVSNTTKSVPLETSC